MNSSNPVPEPLTRRENDILLLLSKNLTDREIADQLVLSLNSVKWYVRQIYGKLGVSKRREAVATARNLNLLSTETPFKKTAHNLPNPLTSFIGRAKEKDQVIKLVLEYPLVTITGVGGVGKTRLALKAAKELVDAYPDGVWWVELASIRDPYSVSQEVASVLQVRDVSDQALIQSLRGGLRTKCMLLILDNCEHLIDSVAELCSCLLAECPKLHILTTSREVLNVDGEVPFRCPPLSLPSYFPAHTAESKLLRAEASDAVRLFIDRGAVALPGFVLTEKNVVTISGICQHLDGIPLAIELAASQLRFLNIEQIAACLDDVFHLSVGSKRSVLPQHKTLRATIDWSYQLLNSPEQILLRRLSVFAGGWTLDAAEAVAAGDGVEPAEVVNLTGELVDKSLILVETGAVEENRYRMLETIRQYSNERLVEAGEYKMVNDRHLVFFFSLADTVSPLDTHQFTSLPNAVRLLKEWGNIRLALKWALETNIELGLRVCTSFIDAATLDLSMELDGWLERLLAAQLEERIKRGNQPDEFEYKFIRGKALRLMGTNRMFWGMKDKAVRALLESKALFESVGEPGKLFVASIGMHLGSLTISTDPEQSMIYLETSRNYFKMMDEKAYLSECDRILTAL